MKISSKPATGLYVPVYRNEPEPIEQEIIHRNMDMMTIVLIAAIACFGIAGIAYSLGIFESPNEKLEKELVVTQKQLNQATAKLDQINQCLGR